MNAIRIAMSRVIGVPVEDVMYSPEARKAFFLAADTLKSKESIALILKASGMTLQAIGDILGCTKERVRQYECKGLRQLRHPTRIRSIMPFVKEL